MELRINKADRSALCHVTRQHLFLILFVVLVTKSGTSRVRLEIHCLW